MSVAVTDAGGHDECAQLVGELRARIHELEQELLAASLDLRGARNINQNQTTTIEVLQRRLRERGLDVGNHGWGQRV